MKKVLENIYKRGWRIRNITFIRQDIQGACGHTTEDVVMLVSCCETALRDSAESQSGMPGAKPTVIN